MWKKAVAEHGHRCVRLTVANDNDAIAFYEVADFKMKSARLGYKILECSVE